MLEERTMEFFTVAEVAEKLRLSPSFVYALIDTGTLKAHRFTVKGSGVLRISREHLDEYLAGVVPQGCRRSSAGHIR